MPAITPRLLHVRSSLRPFCPFFLLVELNRYSPIMHAAEAVNLTPPAASKLPGELKHVPGV